MTTRLDVSIGPVQGFVSQSRRTRDLWGSSYLLAFLSAHAMRGAQDTGGKVIQPLIADDPLFEWISGKRRGDRPRIGTVPNHFVVEIPGGTGSAVANAATESLNKAWKQVCDAVWKPYVAAAAQIGAGTEDIWGRQVHGFWEVTWTVGNQDDDMTKSHGGLLARRKHWRTHRPSDEPGDKCTVMSDRQELSGFVRARGKQDRQSQDQFWSRVSDEAGALDLRDNERLCAIALVKRLFPRVAEEALGWRVDTTSWPSTVYVGALPWIRRSSRPPHSKRAITRWRPRARQARWGSCSLRRSKA